MSNNFNLSNFGLGTVQFGLDYGFTKRKTQDEVNVILKTAVDNDINLIDTAREYGDSEEKIGNFISENDNDFVIATKLKLIDNVEYQYSTIMNAIAVKTTYGNFKKISKLDSVEDTILSSTFGTVEEKAGDINVNLF